jgi:hypothetical protein
MLEFGVDALGTGLQGAGRRKGQSGACNGKYLIRMDFSDIFRFMCDNPLLNKAANKH